MMLHALDLGAQEVEELAEELWTLHEEGRLGLDDLARTTQVHPMEPALERLVAAGLARRDGGNVTLTASGRELAARQVRRHRLAEVLFTTVMRVADEEAVNRTACVIEHVLDPATTDSVCAFVGHPRACPHGKPIPPGDCCRTLARPQSPLVEPLSRVPPGSEVQVVYMVSRDPRRLVRLGGLGLVPGARLRLQQETPAVVVAIGETTVALDPEIADEVYVRR
jgi:DtxR family Mn-dependent transcriptional regulator